MHLPSRRVRAAAAVFAAVLTLGACADDNDDLDASPIAPRVTATPTATATATADDFCAAKVAIDAAFLAGGEPEEAAEGATPDPAVVGAALDEQFSDVYAELERTAQAEVAGEVATLVAALDTAIEEGSEEFFFDPAFAEAESAVDEYLLENCGFNELQATAADYEYTGLASRIDAGLASITLVNEGEEFHEIILFRINDDTTLSAEEIFELPEEEAMALLNERGPASVTLAVPGQTSTSFYDLPEGRYAAICFIGKDSTVENMFQGDGPPHFLDGMLEELIVGDVPSPTPSPA